MAPGPHCSDLAGHIACPPSDETNLVVPEGSMVETMKSEASGVQQFRAGVGSPVMEGGCQFVSGEALYTLTSLYTVTVTMDASMYGRVGKPNPGVGITFRPFPWDLGPGGGVAPYQWFGALGFLADA